MSSPKAAAKLSANKTSVKNAHRAAKIAQRRVATARGTAKPKFSGNGIAADAKQLAATIERELGAGRVDMLAPETMQRLIAALCNTYSAQIEAGGRFTPVPEGSAVSPTAVMVTASGLLRAANLAVFELGMWQSWTGR
jgi:hypothetical protein